MRVGSRPVGSTGSGGGCEDTHRLASDRPGSPARTYEGLFPAERLPLLRRGNRAGLMLGVELCTMRRHHIAARNYGVCGGVRTPFSVTWSWFGRLHALQLRKTCGPWASLALPGSAERSASSTHSSLRSGRRRSNAVMKKFTGVGKESYLPTVERELFRSTCSAYLRRPWSSRRRSRSSSRWSSSTLGRTCMYRAAKICSLSLSTE